MNFSSKEKVRDMEKQLGMALEKQVVDTPATIHPISNTNNASNINNSGSEQF